MASTLPNTSSLVGPWFFFSLLFLAFPAGFWMMTAGSLLLIITLSLILFPDTAILMLFLGEEKRSYWGMRGRRRTLSGVAKSWGLKSKRGLLRGSRGHSGLLDWTPM